MRQHNNINFSLFLNKPYHDSEEAKKMYEKKNGDEYKFSLNERFVKKKRDKKGKPVEVTGKEKYEKLDRFDFSGIDCAQITSRQKANIAVLFPKTKALTFKPEWRLTLGLGGASVFNTDITLHHIYGVPYIPASSIKGVVRSWIIETVFDTDEAKAIKCKAFCDLFGCSKEHKIHTKGKDGRTRKSKHLSWYGEQHKAKNIDFYESKGKVTFFDALPTSSEDIHISMDIMNVHYKDYYDSTKQKDGTYRKDEMKPPADWSNPTIINFLTVKNTPFQFLLASKDDSLNKLKVDDKTIDAWLKEALTHHGIGAKTAVGYGYFKNE